MNENTAFTAPVPTPVGGNKPRTSPTTPVPPPASSARPEITNHVHVNGIYTGPILVGSTVVPAAVRSSIPTRSARSIEDLAMDKSVTPVEFIQGGRDLHADPARVGVRQQLVSW